MPSTTNHLWFDLRALCINQIIGLIRRPINLCTHLSPIHWMSWRIEENRFQFTFSHSGSISLSASSMTRYFSWNRFTWKVKASRTPSLVQLCSKTQPWQRSAILHLLCTSAASDLHVNVIGITSGWRRQNHHFHKASSWREFKKRCHGVVFEFSDWDADVAAMQSIDQSAERGDQQLRVRSQLETGQIDRHPFQIAVCTRTDTSVQNSHRHCQS